MQALSLRCPTCGTVRPPGDRFCRRCGRSFAIPLVRTAARAIAPLVFATRQRPTSLWQGVALLALGATVTVARRWAVRRAVRALLPLLLARAFEGHTNGVRRGTRITELTVTLRQRVEEH